MPEAVSPLHILTKMLSVPFVTIWPWYHGRRFEKAKMVQNCANREKTYISFLPNLESDPLSWLRPSTLSKKMDTSRFFFALRK